MKIGFAGTGAMGKPMALRLLSAGHELYVYNRTREKTAELERGGAVVSDSPAEAASEADLIFSMVTNNEALYEITLGDHGILSASKVGATHIDCSTVLPSVTTKLYSDYKNAGKNFIHAPVLGSIPQATEGSLLIFPGGDKAVIEMLIPVLNLLSKKIWVFDAVAKSSAMKIALNSIIAGTITMLSQSMTMVQKSGMQGETFLEILSHSVLNSQTMQFKGKSILENNFEPRFTVENLLKDAVYMKEAAESVAARSDLAELTIRLLAEAVDFGAGKEDYSALVKIFAAGKK